MKCEFCRFWSQLVAEARGGVVYAYCLNQTGPHAGGYTSEAQGCESYQFAEFGGAVDLPPWPGAYDEPL